MSMKWPSDFPHMVRRNSMGHSSPSFIGLESVSGHFAYKGDQWFAIGKRKEGDTDTDYVLADRDVELVTDPDALAKLGSAVDYHNRRVAYQADYDRAHPEPVV